MSWQVTSFEGEALYALQDKFRKMAEQAAEQQPCSPESPTRYSLPPTKKQKGRASRKTKAAPYQLKGQRTLQGEGKNTNI